MRILLEKKAGAVYFFKKKTYLEGKSSPKVYAIEYFTEYISTEYVLCFWRRNLSLLEYLCLVREPEKMIVVQAKVA